LGCSVYLFLIADKGYEVEVSDTTMMPKAILPVP